MPWRDQIERWLGANLFGAGTLPPPDFGDLRELLQRPPSEDLWLHVALLLQRAQATLPKDSFEHEWLEYAAAHMSSWPRHLRTCPLPWRESFFRSEDPPRALRLVRRLELVERAGAPSLKLKKVLKCDALKRVEELSIGGWEMTPATAIALVESGPWENLDVLAIERVALDGELEALLSTRHDALSSLGLREANLTDAHFHALLSSPLAEHLTSLALSNNALGSAAGALIAANTSALTELDLSHTTLEDEGVEALVSGEALANASVIRLANNGIGGEGMRAMARARWAPRVLDLSHNPLAGGDIETLTSCAWYQGTRELDLSHIALGEESLAALARASTGHELRALRARHARLGLALPEWLERCDWRELEALDLSHNDLMAHHIDALLETPLTRTIERLVLSYNRLNDAAIERIAGANWGALRVLDLSNNAIGDAGAMALARANFSGVELDLSNNILSEATTRALDASPAFESVRYESYKVPHVVY